MSNTYQVLSANYDGSYPTSQNPANNNPLVWVYLARNGQRLGYALMYWAMIQNIFAVAGAAGLQSYFAAVADFYAGSGSFNPPTFPANTAPIPAPVTGSNASPWQNPDIGGVSCGVALVGSWTQ